MVVRGPPSAAAHCRAATKSLRTRDPFTCHRERKQLSATLQPPLWLPGSTHFLFQGLVIRVKVRTDREGWVGIHMGLAPAISPGAEV